MSQTVIVTTKEDLTAIISALFATGVGAMQMPAEVIELEKLKRKEMLTTEEVEALYGLNANTLRRRRVTGVGPAYSKDGERVYYTHSAIKKYLESRRQKTYDQP